MSHMLCVVILAVAVSVDAVRDESDKDGDLIHVSVKPTNFQLFKPAESVDQLGLDKAEEERASMTTEEAEGQLAQAAGGLDLDETADSELQDQFLALRKAVDELSADELSTAAAEKAESMHNAWNQSTAESEKAESKHALQSLMEESQHVKQMAEYLDQMAEHLESKYTELLENRAKEASTAVNKPAEAKEESIAAIKSANANTASIAAGRYKQIINALESQLATLDSKKEALVQFFGDLKEVKQASGRVMAEKAQAVTEALNAGLSQKEVQQELSKALAVPSHVPAHMQKAHHKASREVEMRIVELMSALAALQRWKQSNDNSPGGLKKARDLEVQLSKTLKSLAAQLSSGSPRELQVQLSNDQVAALKHLYEHMSTKVHTLMGSGKGHF